MNPQEREGGPVEPAARKRESATPLDSPPGSISPSDPAKGHALPTKSGTQRRWRGKRQWKNKRYSRRNGGSTDRPSAATPPVIGNVGQSRLNVSAPSNVGAQREAPQQTHGAGNRPTQLGFAGFPESTSRPFVVIELPSKIGFLKSGVYDFSGALKIFDWSLHDADVLMDFSGCEKANYQALALMVLYVWHLRIHGCRVEFRHSEDFAGASKMWQLMGATGWSHVLRSPANSFRASRYKPLIAIRNHSDARQALEKAEKYTRGFNVEYEKTLRYIISELLYNTMEHGPCYYTDKGLYLANLGAVDSSMAVHQCPSIIQFTWYRNKDSMSFMIADLGIGIKRHLEKAYPAFQSDCEAIQHAIKPGVSGTFSTSDPYKSKDNAGVGLFISSNIVRRLNAEMYIVSGNGVLHISPRDKTEKQLEVRWPGTFVLVNVRLRKSPLSLNLHQMMSEFREAAVREISSSHKRKKRRASPLISAIFLVYTPTTRRERSPIVTASCCPL